MSPTHSPLPWAIKVYDWKIEIVDADGSPIVWGEGDDMAHEVWAHQEDIRMIVEAVNAKYYQEETKD